jgi:hypothetical protein
MKRHIAIGLMLGLMIFSVLTAGCTSNVSNTTSPSNTSKSTQLGTSTSTSSVVTVTVPATPTPTPPQQQIATKIEGDKYVSIAMSSGIIRDQPYTFGFSIFTLPETPGRILCGQYMNFYIDGTSAGGTWQRSGSDASCFASDFLVLSAQDTAKLSKGAHTLVVDYLGGNTYAPSHFEGTFYVRAN